MQIDGKHDKIHLTVKTCVEKNVKSALAVQKKKLHNVHRAQIHVLYLVPGLST